VTIEVRARLGELVDQQLDGAPCVGPADRRRRQGAAPVQNIWLWYPDGGLLLPGTGRTLAAIVFWPVDPSPGPVDRLIAEVVPQLGENPAV
jgi:hypothetical protein